jgi:hypothetical protein
VIFNVQLIECGQAAAMNAYRRGINPERVDGLRFARTYLTAELRRGMLPSLAVTGAVLFTAWDDQECAERFRDHPVARRFSGGYELSLQPARSIGLLPGLPELPRREIHIPDGTPVAAYTSGRVKVSRFLPFLRAAAAAEREAVGHPGFLEGITIMRPPMGIATFSLWRSLASMRDYVTGSYPGGHARAVQADRRKGFNSEMFFSRHIPLATSGTWRGRDPLAGLLRSPSANGQVAPGATLAVPDRHGAPVHANGKPPS